MGYKFIRFQHTKGSILFCSVLISFLIPSSSFSTPFNPSFFIIDSYIVGWFKGFSQQKERRIHLAFHQANLAAKNDLRIWGGLFVTNRSNTFGKRTLELGSRLTYQIPQTLIGLFYAHFENTITQNTYSVCYFGGATVLQGNRDLMFDQGGPAVTLGSYIIANHRCIADPDNSVFQHEYGHYLQSKKMGWAYLGVVGIPSLRSLNGHYDRFFDRHDSHPAEQDANRRAFIYFNQDKFFQNDTNYSAPSSLTNKGWDFRRNPFEGVGELRFEKRQVLNYIDYSKINHRLHLNALILNPHWFDYVFPLFSGFYNTWKYNYCGGL